MAPPYQAGDIVERCQPFSITPGGRLPHTTCHHCLRSAQPLVVTEQPARLKRCTACLHVSYCSKQCQKSDWDAIHKDECRYLKRCGAGNAPPPPMPVRHLARCVLRIARAAAAVDESVVDEKERQLVERFQQLETPIGKLSQSRPFVDSCGAVKRQLRQYLAGNAFVKTLSDAQLFNIECRWQFHNSKLIIAMATMFKMGTVMCVQAAELRHSCNPSVSAVFREDGFVYLLANRRIESEADVSISYVNTLRATEVRQNFLYTTFIREDCSCELCVTRNTARDDTLRSIRCARALESGGFANCDAPCPMTKEQVPAVEMCANGHNQQEFYRSEEGRAHLRRYRAAVNAYETAAYRFRGRPMDWSARAHDLVSAWKAAAHYWHPLNGHVLGSLERANTLMSSGQMALVDAWSEQAHKSFFSDGMLGKLADLYRRHFKADEVEQRVLFDEMLTLLMERNLKAETLTESDAAALVVLVRQLVPLAELYYGADSRCYKDLRSASEMSASEYSKTVPERYRTLSKNMALRVLSGKYKR